VYACMYVMCVGGCPYWYVCMNACMHACVCARTGMYGCACMCMCVFMHVGKYVCVYAGRNVTDTKWFSPSTLNPQPSTLNPQPQGMSLTRKPLPLSPSLSLDQAPVTLRRALQAHLHGDELYKIPFLREMQSSFRVGSS
jgi:hypothetical protein